MDPQIKVTKIKNRWHARLLLNDQVIDEMACEDRLDIGWISREMLRWYDKLYGDSEFASVARHRQTSCKGKVWYKGELDIEREQN